MEPLTREKEDRILELARQLEFALELPPRAVHIQKRTILLDQRAQSNERKMGTFWIRLFGFICDGFRYRIISCCVLRVRPAGGGTLCVEVENPCLVRPERETAGRGELVLRVREEPSEMLQRAYILPAERLPLPDYAWEVHVAPKDIKSMTL